MNRAEHLMTIVMEECDEVSQRVSKAKRFGMLQVQQARGDKPEQNPERLTNKQRILDEFYDLVAVMEMCGIIETSESGDPAWSMLLHIPTVAIQAKMAKVEHYLKMSAECGTLEE